ncbi:lasso RiPP family leader peptide-containing protein [Streptomyces sp. URMC 129]
MEQRETVSEERTYEAPAVVEVGAFAELTLGPEGDQLEFISLRTAV